MSEVRPALGAAALKRLKLMMDASPSQRPCDWANPIEKIEEMLSCPICLDRYKNPRILPCQHSFCLECLDAGPADPIRRVLKCPECRAEHRFSGDGAKSFPANLTLISFLEIHLQASEESAEEMESYIKRYNQERCKVCEEKADCVVCPHCEKRVCPECKTTHLDMIKRDLSRLMGQVKRLSSRITEASDGLSKGLESLSLNCESVKEDVRDATRRLYRDLKKKEDSLIMEVDTWLAVESRLMKGLRESLELESSNVNEACARVEAWLKGERELPELEVVKYKQMFTDGLDFLRTFSVDADDLCQKKIRLHLKDHIADLPQHISNLGDLQVLLPQFGGRFQQLEAQYVPKLLNLGLESESKPRARYTDPESERVSSRSAATNRGGRSEEERLSMRYRRRTHHLDDATWQRIPEASATRSPRRSAAFDDDGSPPHSYARHHLEASPFQKVTPMGDPMTTSLSGESSGSSSGAAAPTTSTGTSSAVPAKKKLTRQASSEEDPSLNLKVENIRKEYEVRKLQQRIPPHSPTSTTMPPRPTPSPTPIAVPTPRPANQPTAEEEDSDDLDLIAIGAKPIPVMIYPKPEAPSFGRPPPASSSEEALPPPPANKPPYDTNLDWKKYLIPHPYREIATYDDSGPSRAELWRENKSSSKEEADWSDRRSRVVRSRTNPDLAEAGRAAGSRDTSEEDAAHNAERRSGQRYRRKGEQRAGSSRRPPTAYPTPAIPYSEKGRDGKVCRKFGAKGGGDGEFNWPRGVAIVPGSEDVAVCDSSNHRVQVFDKRGNFLRSFGVYGTGKGQFDCLAGIAVTKYHQFIVSDRYNHRIQVFDEQGNYLREFGAHGQTNGRLNNPWGVAVDGQGFVYVADKDNHRIQIFQADGNYVGKFGGIGHRDGQLQNPHFIAVTRAGHLVVSDSANHRIQVFDHNGQFQFGFGSEGFADGQFKYPRGIAVDSQGFIVVADSGNNRVQVFYPDGSWYATFGGWGVGEGQLKGVEGVALSPDGRVVVTDRENHRIQIF